MLEEHQGILWLAGQVFLSRTFVEDAEATGLEAVFARCPYPDLTEDEKATFTAAFKSEKLRVVVQEWWLLYDEERKAGVIPATLSVWQA